MKKRKERRAKLLAVLAAAAVAFTSVLPVYAVEAPSSTESSTEQTQVLTLEEQASAFLDGIDTATPFQTVKGIYDKMKKELAFDAAGASDVSAVLTDKIASSEGYAKAFDLLCETAKLKCLTVKGVSGWWNLVQLDQKWYGVDVSSDDRDSTSARFLVGTGTLIGDKTFEESYVGTVQDSEMAVTVSEMKYGETVVKDVTITPTVLSKTYGDADPVIGYTCSETGLVLTGALSRTPGEAVGTYPISIGTLAVADNAKAASYKLTLASNSVFTVTQRPLTVADAALKAESKIYDGSPAVALSGITLGNVIAGDDVSVDMAKAQAVVSSVEAGDYTAIALYDLSLVGASAGNYSIAKQNIDKSFTITLPDGSEIATGEAPELEEIESDLINAASAKTKSSGSSSESSESTGSSSEESKSSDNSTVRSENTSSTFVSNEIPGNFSVSNESTSVLTEKTALTVVVKPESIEYGDELPASYTYKLYQNGTEISAEGINVVIGIEGDGKSVGTYSYTVSGENEAYTLALDPANTSALTVEPKKVQILFELPEGGSLAEGVYTIPYTDAMVALTAYYTDISGERVEVPVTYNEAVSAPSAIGTYAVAAAVSDTNYQADGQQVTSLVITKKNMDVKNLTRSITAGDTEIHQVALSEFGVPSDAVKSVYVYNLEYSNGLILAEQPSVADGALQFKMLENVPVGSSVKIILRSLPDHMIYNQTEFSVTVTVEELGYTAAVAGAPTKVTLGRDIALSDAFKLIITYDNGTRVEEKVTAAMLSGYDKNAAGSESIGNKTITVTSASVEGASASFTITVADAVLGLQVTPPDQLTYTRGDTRFDLYGGTVSLKMRSGIAQTKTALTKSMLSVGTSILKKVGEYDVDVSYNGYTARDAFIFKVLSTYGDSDSYYVDKIPDKGDFGMNLTKKDLVDGDDYDISDLRLIISDDVDPDDVDEIEELVDRKDWDGYEAFDAYLVDEDGYYVSLKREAVLYLPYPDGIDREDYVIGVYHKPDSRFNTESVTLAAKHILVKIDDFSPFAVVWREKYSSSDRYDDDDDDRDSSLSESVKYQQEMKAFWEDVVEELEDTASGKTVTIDAGEYDYVPSSVLKAIRGRNVTLKIRNDTTKTIVLNGRNLPVSSTVRASYTMKELYKAVNGSSSSAGSTGSSSGSSSSGSTLEDLWSSVVKSLKSYNSGTVVTINAKNNPKVPKSVLDAIRGKNITVNLKSDDYATIVLKGDELPVTLKSKTSYTLGELSDAVTPPSAAALAKQWKDVVEHLEKTKAGMAVTVNAGASAFIPDAVFEAIRGRNVTLKLKSDYYTGTVSVTGTNMPSGLKGQKAYSIAQVLNRAKKTTVAVSSSASYVSSSSVTEGNPTTGMEPVGTTGISSVMQQSSAAVARDPAANVGQMSSSSSEVMVAPPIIDIPDLEKEENAAAPSVPAIESTEEARTVVSLDMIAAIGTAAVAAVIVVLMIVFRGTRRRHRRS